MITTITRRKGVAAALALSFCTPTAMAANWLMLQGTEPAGSAARAKLWGFIQAQYQKDLSDANNADQYIPPKLIGPDLESQESFNVNRARIGVRGANLPLDSNTNYFLLAEFGNNGITAPGNSFVHLTDASVTFNHIPHARIRVGLFKYPGAEEGLQAIHVFDYINFTEVSNQLMLERFQSSKTGTHVGPQTLPPAQKFNTFDKPVGAFRDVGIQVFDAFREGDWEHSYAAMVGNGSGLTFSDTDDDKDLYLYWASEKIFGGKGPRREGLKLFTWYQTGKRAFDANNDGKVERYDRTRWGLGAKYLKKPWRATAEYMAGEGMIFQGPQNSDYSMVPPGNPNSCRNNIDGAACGLNAKAYGYYVEGGYHIPGTNFELDARYDFYKRNKDSQFEIDYKTLTLGAQYFINKKTRVTFNYAFRDFNAVKFASGAGPNANLDGVKGRASVQVTAIF